MTIEEAVNKFVDSGAHIISRYGSLVDMFVDKNHSLVVDEKLYEDQGFSHGCYIPHYKEWLIANCLLIEC